MSSWHSAPTSILHSTSLQQSIETSKQKIVTDKIATNESDFFLSDLVTGCIRQFTINGTKINRVQSFNVEGLGMSITNLTLVTQSNLYIFRQTGSVSNPLLDLLKYDDNDNAHVWMLFNADFPPYNNMNKVINACVNNDNLLYLVTIHTVYCIDLIKKYVMYKLHTKLPIIYACIDVHLNLIYLVHNSYTDSEHDLSFITVYNDKLEKLYNIQTLPINLQSMNMHFVVNNGLLFHVVGNEITIYSDERDVHKNHDEHKLTMLQSYTMEHYPPDVETVFNVTTSEFGTLIVAGYDQDEIYILHYQ